MNNPLISERVIHVLSTQKIFSSCRKSVCSVVLSTATDLMNESSWGQTRSRAIRNTIMNIGVPMLSATRSSLSTNPVIALDWLAVIGGLRYRMAIRRTTTIVVPIITVTITRLARIHHQTFLVVRYSDRTSNPPNTIPIFKAVAFNLRWINSLLIARMRLIWVCILVMLLQ